MDKVCCVKANPVSDLISDQEKSELESNVYGGPVGLPLRVQLGHLQEWLEDPSSLEPEADLHAPPDTGLHTHANITHTCMYTYTQYYASLVVHPVY